MVKYIVAIMMLILVLPFAVRALAGLKWLIARVGRRREGAVILNRVRRRRR